VDGIGPAGICGRNSRIGVTGNWGTLFYGNWDTPFKAVAYGTKADDPFLNTDVYGFNGIMGSPGFNYRSGAWSTASNTTIIGFDVRAQNSVAYHTPRWEGLSARLQYAANEFKNATGTQNPELFGAAVNYDRGPFSVLAAYERHNDGYALAGINPAPAAGGTYAPVFGATAPNTAGTATAAISSNDSAWRVGAGYQLDSPFGATTVSGLFEQLMLKQENAPVGAVTEYKRNAWQVALKHRMGDHELRARYNQASAGSCALSGGAACSTSGYGANQFAVGYAYYFAKSFQGYLSFTRINNQYNATYTPSIGGSPAVAGATPRGADPKAVGLGLRYAF
jgi:predicted porin